MAAETGSQKSSDSGKVYDFKDSKTSGVVTVTKSWDDSMSNDERPVPDISISTSKPGKNPLGYTITYHGNGLTFADGSSENEIVVNDSGKIVSGKYELPGNTAVTWYLDSQCTSNNGLPLSGIFSDLDLYAKTKTFVIKDTNTTSGKQYFNNLIPDTATKVVFTDEAIPASATLIDVDADGDVGVVAWMEGTVMKVSSQVPGQKVIAPMYSHLMFNSKSNLSSIDFSNLDTSNVVLMTGMFNCCNNLTNLDLSTLNTSNVVGMDSMFAECASLTSLDLTPLDTQKVTNMSWMFYNCSGLTALDLSLIDTSKVTNMNAMFKDCSTLTHLSLGEKFAFVGSEYNLPSGTWYSSNGTAYTSDGNSCTIPNNKANTYTRR